VADKSAIQWTDATWNPVTGCTKISPGCKHCYAEKWSQRMRNMGVEKYQNGFKLTLHPETLGQPLSWKEPRRVFVNSMSDLFHDEIPDEYIGEVLNICGQTPQHTYQILTKRADRLPAWEEDLMRLPNVWVGVSVEDQARAQERIVSLLLCGTHTPFVSAEPILGPLDLSDWLQAGIVWVIVGGESGPMYRPPRAEWIRAIRDQCLKAGVPFFFKQWGGFRPKSNGRCLDGRTWDEFPEQSCCIRVIPEKPAERTTSRISG
jgi:protein gp37